MEPDINPQPKAEAPADGAFVKKTVERPILDSAVRDQLSAGGGNMEAASPGFYKANKLYIWASVIGVAIISVLAFFAFRPQPAPTAKEANVQVSIDVPATVASGGEAVYRFTVQNNDTQKLTNMELELTYPSGVQYYSSVPNPEGISGSLFKVPDLLPGLNAVVIVKTKVSGNVNDEKKLTAKLHYSLANFNSEFIKEAQASIKLVASDLLLEVSGPTTANNGQLLMYTVHYHNNSDQELKNARVEMTYPDGFEFASATPAPDIGSNVWNMPSIGVNGDGNITIQGSFKSASPGESKTMTADLEVLGDNGDYNSQKTASFNTAFANLPLLVTQELYTSNSNGVVKPGDALEFQVKYQNNAATAATAVNVLVTINSKAVDLSSLTAEGGTVSNNTILWNASGVPQLENLAPSESGQLSFRLKIKDPAVKDSTTNLTLASTIKIKANEYESYFPGNELDLKISSPLKIDTRLDYSLGELPPKVGKSTTYKVRLALSNYSNDYQDGTLTAFIPLGPSGFVQGSPTPAEAPNVDFDPSTGKLTWRVKSLPAYTGIFSEPKVLEFSVKLSPSASQAGSSPVLVKDIAFAATDSFTSQAVQVAANNLATTDLFGQDGYAKGEVQK